MLTFIVRLRNLWERIKTSFWLVPTTMVLISVGFFLSLSVVDREYQLLTFLFFDFLDPVGAEGARTVLATIAGSMITAAGTVFSITIVILTIASNQFGPRLVRNFMTSLTSQVVLGSFISTFVYSLLVMSSIQPETNTSFVPRVSINFAVLLAMLNVAVLIRFVHFVVTFIQPEYIVRSIHVELLNRIHSFFPESSSEDTERKKNITKTINRKKSDPEVHLATDGYLQAIDKEKLCRLASKNDWLITVQDKPGEYVHKHTPVVRVSGTDDLDAREVKAICSCFLTGPHRTSEQDAEYAILQLVEIAVRALSPGINDPFTAITCIDHLGTAVGEILERRAPPDQLADSSGNLRVELRAVNPEGLVDAAFNQIRQHAEGNEAVLIRLMEVLEMLSNKADSRLMRDNIERHMKMIEKLAKGSFQNPEDVKDLRDRKSS